MSRILLYIAFIFLLSSPAFADNGDKLRFPYARYDEQPRAEWQGDSLAVSFSSRMAGRIKGVEALHLIPIYIIGNDTVRYPTLSYYTPSGSRYYKRHTALTGEQPTGKIRVVRSKDNGKTDYYERRLAPTSKQGQLQILHVISDCCGYYVVARDTVAVPSIPLQTDTVYITVEKTDTVYINVEKTDTVMVAPPKGIERGCTLNLTYPQNRWEVLPDFGDNRAELQQIDRLLAPVADNPDYELLSLHIAAYASIEATYQYNLKLSERRAQAMCDYIHAHYAIPRSKLTSEGRGEDWDGLREAVSQSDMPYRKEVLHIIDTVGIFNDREKRLMGLQHGEPYHYMLQNLFPQLRRIRLTITYKTVEQR